MRSFEDYVNIKNDMVTNDNPRDEDFRGYDRIYHFDWKLPGELQNVARENISSDPYDAINTAVRVMTALSPHIYFHPPYDNPETKEFFDEIENTLKWQLWCANSRREETIEADLMRSSLLYHACIANVVDLDYQIKQLDLFSGSTNRLKAMRRYGRFYVQTYNPKDVHVRRSGIMPEAVLLCQIRRAQSVLDEWGNLCPIEIKQLAESNSWITYNDYMDWEVHLNWCDESDRPIIPKENWEHNMDFLPWTTVMGGSTLESAEEDKYKPLLYSIYKSGQWDTQNIARSVWISDVLTKPYAPDKALVGPNPNLPAIDYTDPMNKYIKVPTGDEIVPLAPPVPNPSLKEVNDYISNWISSSTVQNILRSGSSLQNEAFASLNLKTQLAIGALRPYKLLTERALAEILKTMVLWSIYTKEPLEGYGMDKRSNYGKQYSISSEMLDPMNLYIETELDADNPMDKQQRVNTATAAVQVLNYPIEYALEDIGINNPKEAMLTRYGEKLIENEVNLIMQDSSLTLQEKHQRVQMQYQLAAQQQAQQQIGPGGFPGGPQNAPNQGGNPPAMNNPGGMTREAVNPGEGMA